MLQKTFIHWTSTKSYAHAKKNCHFLVHSKLEHMFQLYVDQRYRIPPWVSYPNFDQAHHPFITWVLMAIINNIWTTKHWGCVPILGGSKNNISMRGCVLVLFVWPLRNATNKIDCCVLLSIGDEMVTIDANPMCLVHSILYCPCTRRIGFASIVTVLTPIDQQLHTCFFCCHRICTTAYKKFMKKNPQWTDICSQNCWFKPPKTGSLLGYCIIIGMVGTYIEILITLYTRLF